MLNSTQPAGQGGRMDFTDWLTRVCGRSAATAAAYERDAAAFADWASGQGLSHARALSRAQLGLYLMERMQPGKRWAAEQRKLGARSAARIVSALRAWQNWLRFSGELAAGEGFEPQPPKYSRRLPDYYNTAEMEKLVGAWDGDSAPLSLRNSAMLHLLYATGIRASELCGLDLGDMEPGARLLRVRGKGNRERVVPYGERAAAALERWLEAGRAHLEVRHLMSHNSNEQMEVRLQSDHSNEQGVRSKEPAGATRSSTRNLKPETGNPKPDPSSAPPSSLIPPHSGALFLNHRGGRLTRRGLHDVIDRSALRAGLVKSLSTHKLRHACATHLLEGGADVRLVQELLGHQSLATTQIYTQVTRTQLLDAFEKSHPRAKK